MKNKLNNSRTPNRTTKSVTLPITHSTENSMSLPKLNTTTTNKITATTYIQKHEEYKNNAIINNSNIHINTKFNTESSPRKIKKPLYQYNKVNWSLPPSCLVQGHQGYPVLYVCIQPQCQHDTRLICEQCFYKDHKIHNKKYLAVDEIKNGNINSLRYWPFDQDFRKMYEFIKKHDAYVQGLIQDIKSSFQNLKQSVLNSIKITQNKFLQKITQFYSKYTTKSKFINTLITDLQNNFKIKQIQNCVKQIFNKQVRHDVFMQNINKVLTKDEETQQKLRKIKQNFECNQTDRGIDMQFNKIYFMKKQKVIIQNINQLHKALKQQKVIIDDSQIGLQQIITQTIQFLNKNSTALVLDSPIYPITYQRKKFDDGTLYYGFIQKNLRVILGMRDYCNDNIYYGQWKNNCRSGWGVFYNKQTLYKYQGTWKQDKRNGFGKQSTSAYYYQGGFLNDKKDGFGTIKQNGIRYDITWKNDKKNGKGKKISQSGEETEVYFLNGIQSVIKGSAPINGQATSYKDVSNLAKLFGGSK